MEISLYPLKRSKTAFRHWSEANLSDPAISPVKMASAIALPLLELSLGKNLLEMGEEFKMGDLLLPKSTVLGPAEYGILAQAGKTSALLHQSPRAAIVSTGNELEEPNLMPGPGHIRNSNGPMLMSQAVRAGCLPRFLGIARDTPEATEKLLKEGLDHQILIISGGGLCRPKRPGTHDS